MAVPGGNLLDDVLQRSDLPMGWMPGDVVPGDDMWRDKKKKKSADEIVPKMPPTGDLGAPPTLAGVLAAGPQPVAPAAAPDVPGSPQFVPQDTGMRPGSIMDNLLRKTVPGIDASAPAIQSALGNMPPGMPQAGMLPSIPPGAAVPLPAPRPDSAPPREVDGGRAGVANDSEGAGGPPPPPAAQQQAQQAPQGAPPPVGPPGAPQQPAGPSFLQRMGAGMLNGLQNNSSTLMALGAGFAGAPNIGQGISRGASAAVPAMQADQKNRMAMESQSQLYKALVDAGVPKQQALAGSTDKQLAQKLMDEYVISQKRQTVKLADTDGAEHLYSINPRDPKDIVRMDTGDTAPAPGSGLTGEAFLASQPEPYQRVLKSYAKGDQLLPTGRAALNPEGKKLIRDVLSYDGSASPQDFNTRAAVRKRYTSGKDFDLTKTYGTVANHGRDLYTAIQNLHNYSILPDFLNKVTGKVSEQYDKQYQHALGEFEQAADTYSRDYDVAVSGGRPSVSGRQEQRKLYDPYAAPEKLLGAFQKSTEMLSDRLHEHVRGYEAGRMPHETSGSVPGLDPDSVSFIENMARNGTFIPKPHGGPPQAAAAPAATKAPPPGKYVFDPATGAMKPVAQ